MSTLEPVLIDCTLRDGGYHNDWDFPVDLIEEYLQAMGAISVDVVELGFRGFEPRELCPSSGHSETECKKTAAIRPSRKRVAQRDCFQSATDFSERLLQRARSKARVQQ